LLAASFLITGVTKLLVPRRRLAAGPMRWPAEASDARLGAIGLLEVAGAVGLILPGVSGPRRASPRSRRSGSR
jgi:uncharacterized membrane protein